ncbi:putative efflux pump antibiotic resistance protein [Xylaria longipes]|nr:putative efflux pump antibiotic resistance protein [Xylaria longipes]
MDESTHLLQNQSHSLPRKRLLVVFPALALIQFTSFLDQTSTSTSLPAIASALDTGASISLVGASFLITSTRVANNIQLINRRLSDIFGRKASLITALSIIGIRNLLCGLSATPVELFAARAFTSFRAEAINALVQIAVANITTLQQRGYYFSMVRIAVAFGNRLGPVIGGVLTQTIGWRWAFWFVSPLYVIAIGYLVSVWPTSRSTSAEDRIWDKLRLVDWVGAWASLLGIALLLIPISQGGSMSCSSPVTVGMLIAGVMLLGAFVVVEWRLAKLPLMPSRLFRYGRSTNILVYVNISIGWIYWGIYSPAQAGILMLPMVITHGLTSGLAGILISTYGSYKPIIVTGAICWALAAIEKMHYDQATPISKIAVVGVCDGIAVGCSLQPVLVGLFARSDTEDLAVLTGLRNFLRDMGGASGTTVLLLYGQLKSRFSPNLIAKLTSSTFALKDLHLTDEERSIISHGYMKGLRAVFTSFAVLIAIHVVSCVCIQDYGLRRGDTQQQKGVTEEGREDSREDERQEVVI